MISWLCSDCKHEFIASQPSVSFQTIIRQPRTKRYVISLNVGVAGINCLINTYDLGDSQKWTIS